jgi:phosphoribosylglycinamide formyltransferase-1
VKNIAIFASGTGTNARKIIEHFQEIPDIDVRLIVSNRPDAPVLDIAEAHHIESLLLRRREFYESEHLLSVLSERGIDFIVLAGFMWLVPEYLVKAYTGRMVNIHPALLPRFGGKGMYGMRVHRAVAQSGEPYSGITIHYVNERYDEGAIIFQARCAVEPGDSPEQIARKVQRLEHQYYAAVIEKLIRDEPIVSFVQQKAQPDI